MAEQVFPITEAQLTGLFVESITFGIHIVTLGYCLHALFRKGGRWKRWSDVHWGMVAVSLTLFIVATFDVTLGFYHNVKAFVFYTSPGGALDEFTNISEWVNVCRVGNLSCCEYYQ